MKLCTLLAWCGLVQYASSVALGKPAQNSLRNCALNVFGADAVERVISASNETYTDARLGEKIQFTEFPVLIAYVKRAEEVGPLVKCANSAGVKPVPRSGGHSFESFSALDGTFVIDLTHLDYVNVSKDRTSAKVGAGIRLGALYAALDRHGRTFVGGICPTVGLSGLLSSGGFNMQMRTLGTSTNHVLSAEVVTADGDSVTASSESHPDLFWAIRGGGGGTYGIVTSWTLKLLDMPLSAMVQITWNDKSSRFPVAKRFFDWAPRQVAEFTSQVNVYKDYAVVLGWYYGGTSDALNSMISGSGLLDIGKPNVTIAGSCDQATARIFGYTTTKCKAGQKAALSILNVAQQPYAPVGKHPQFTFEESRKSGDLPAAPPWPRFRRLSKSFFVQKDRQLDDDTLKRAVDKIGDLDTASQGWGEWHSWACICDANLSRPDSSDAFPWRESAYAHLEFQIHGTVEKKRQATYENWFADLESFLRPAVGPASYSGYMDRNISTEPLTSYFGRNVCRLIDVKKTYDPLERFTNPFAIPTTPPAGVKCP